jgi:hypothetical protein
MPRQLLVVACLLTLLTGAVLLGCKGEKTGADATATVMPETPTPTAPASGTATPAIAGEDLTQQPGLRDFLSTSGAQVDPQAIIYADLTGDGEAEAIVPVSSGGEGGNIALFVYSLQPSGIEQVLDYKPDMRLQVAIDGGKLTVTEPVSAPGDPLCCPSELKITTYSWDGSQLAVSDQRTVAGTPGAKP